MVVITLYGTLAIVSHAPKECSVCDLQLVDGKAGQMLCLP